jgi:hypothetical protein
VQLEIGKPRVICWSNLGALAELLATVEEINVGARILGESDATHHDEAPADHWGDQFVVIKVPSASGVKNA